MTNEEIYLARSVVELAECVKELVRIIELTCPARSEDTQTRLTNVYRHAVPAKDRVVALSQQEATP
jgi:hypothetical protein